MKFSNKSSNVSSFVAAICITIYIGAIIFGAVQIAIKTGERRNLAEREFNDLVDRAASSSVFLGFLSDSYNQIIRDFLLNSETLSGIIIIGSGGEFAVEREIGRYIIWNGTAPRFRTGVPLTSRPFSLPIRVEGQRNVTVQAVFSYYDYYFYQNVLRNTLFAVLLALIIALTTLIIELLARNKRVYQVRYPDTPSSSSFGSSVTFDPVCERLKSELQRCTSSEQDLVFLCAEFKYQIKSSLFNKFHDETVNFFTSWDLVFEKGDKGVSIIIPDMNFEEGLSKAEDFRNHISSVTNEYEFYIGLSSRAGRLVEAERLMTEAYTALKKALSDSDAYIIGFKSDLEKYRRFIKGKIY